MISSAPILERTSVFVAWGLCVAIVLSGIGAEYQANVPNENWPDGSMFSLVWLSPAFVIVIFRRRWFVIAVYALPVLVLFSARIYYFWQIKALGVNSLYHLHDWATFCHFLMSVFSMLVLILWVFGCLVLMAHKYMEGR